MHPVARLALILLLILLPHPSQACDMVEDLNPASLYEQVAQAEMILLARATGSWPLRPDLVELFMGPPDVAFKPIEVIKGTAGPTVAVTGRLDDALLTQHYVCPVPVFVRNAPYLLFLRRQGDQFTSIMDSRGDGTRPFQLSVGIDAPLSLIRQFVRVQRQGTPEQQRRELEALVTQRLRPDASAVEQLEAHHILDYLRSMSAPPRNSNPGER